MAAADGLALVRRARPGVATAAAMVVVVLCAILPGRQPLWRVFAPGHYRLTPDVAIGRQVLALVPPEAAIVAQAALVPHLSQRATIHMLDAHAPEADYVIGQPDLSPWPNATRAEVERLLRDRNGAVTPCCSRGTGGSC
jgi:hypothetical protein